MRASALLLLAPLALAACRGTTSSQHSHDAAPPAQAARQSPKAQTVPAELIIPTPRGEQRVAVQAEPGSRAERLALIDTAWQEATGTWMERLRENKTAEEHQAWTLANPRPDPAPHVARVQRLVDEDPADAAGLDGLLWMVRHRDLVEAPVREHLLLIERHHLDSDALAAALPRLGLRGGEWAGWLERWSRDSPNRAVRGQALYALAGGARDVAERERLFERLANEYGDVKTSRSTLGEVAKGELFEIRNLAIGKTAPEIEGEDIDGVVFKLSDYRGKVVVLDFWGHW